MFRFFCLRHKIICIIFSRNIDRNWYSTIPTDYSRIIADRLESDLFLRHEIFKPSHKLKFRIKNVMSIVFKLFTYRYHAIWKFMPLLNNSCRKWSFAGHEPFLDGQQLTAIANILIKILSLNKRTARIIKFMRKRIIFTSVASSTMCQLSRRSNFRVRGTDRKKNSVGKKWVDKLQRIFLNSSQRVANTLRIRF